MKINELFDDNELKMLKEELDFRIEDWKSVEDRAACDYIRVLSKLRCAVIESAKHASIDLVPEYVPSTDHTFIMEYTYITDGITGDVDCVSQECVGWYCGEPNDEDTKRYANRNMKATYDL